jgi:hypothetical protein
MSKVIRGHVPLLDEDGEYDPVLFAENNAREQALWGDLIPAKRILQRRGFGVWWIDREAGVINVGDQHVSISEFNVMAALHARIAGIE